MPRYRSLLALLALASAVSAADWPQWLGPHRDGSTTEKVAPWKGDLKILWRQPVGEGHGSPVVADGNVYLHTRTKGKEIEAIDSFDASSGKPGWHVEYPRSPYKGLFGNGPRSTPAVADGKLYAFGPTGILTCVDTKTGAKAWQVDTTKLFNAPKLKFGVSSSPVVAGKRLLVPIGAKDASVVAFDAAKGDVDWKNLNDGASYASPILMGDGKDRAAIFLTQLGLVATRLEDGAALWNFPFKDKLLESSTTPVRLGDKLIVSSITLGTALVAFESKDGRPSPKKVWHTPELCCYFSTPVTVGDNHIYLVSGSILGGQAALHCVDAATGKSLWKKDGVGKYHASLMRTGDNKLLMLEEAGNLVLLDPDPKGYKELCRAKICGQTWAHPALANGMLYVRDDKELVCVQLNN